MPKSANQKLKLLYIIDILERMTDEKHPMNTAQLIIELEKYDIKAERKSIYDDIEQLIQFGYDIILNKSRINGGYYMASRKFELPELKLLVDSVQASRFITQKKSRELIRKLEKLCSVYDGAQLKRQVYVLHRVKTDNESIYYNVNDIYNAIQENKQITFKYLEWNMDKKKVARKNEMLYQISPWSLTWNEENYYLIAYDEQHDMIKHYRVDKMKDIALISKKRLGNQAFDNFDVADYCNKTFGMYGGEEMTISLRFPNELSGVVIDRFGTEVTFRKEDNDSFSVRIQVAVSNQFFGWLAGIGKDVKILSPVSVKEQYRQYLQSIMDSMQQ